ncbi:MAG: sigma 54-interacting transcriptional regulator [Deltaproteobacteria bacterium]|nr:sigma 54-interacting transcriptional regulator [Deltaproteobacteria bacterium]
MSSAFDAKAGAAEAGAAADRIVGASPAARRLRARVKAAARDDLPVWIAGPPGSDAEQVAQAIHRQSPRGGHALAVLDCAAVPAPLLGRALLGCARGFYPALPEAHSGALRRAGGGALLIASARALPPELREALLGALETGRFRSEGGAEQPLSARLMLATAEGGEGGAAESGGGARGESPLGQHPHHKLRIAPLDQRRPDIALLAAEELRRLAEQAGERGPAIRLTADARAALETELWPGDMAELRARIRAALPLCDGPTLDAEALLLATPSPPSFKQAKRAFEARYARALLRRCRGNISRAARLAGKDRKDFYEVLRRSGVHPGDFRR